MAQLIVGVLKYRIQETQGDFKLDIAKGTQVKIAPDLKLGVHNNQLFDVTPADYEVLNVQSHQAGYKATQGFSESKPYPQNNLPGPSSESPQRESAKV